MNSNPDIAYYYPAPYWQMHESNWVKSLLLFFDQVAILLPDYMYGRHQSADQTLVEPLEEIGLLQVLEPSNWIDEKMAKQLANIILDTLNRGVFDELPNSEHFHELSYSRMGYGVDVDLAEFLVDELKAKDLARPSEDGVSVPLHPTVRTTILVILSQLSRVAGCARGLTIHPTTSDHQAIGDLISTLSRDSMPSQGKVIALDLEPVSLNLNTVPLDDILQYRSEHQDTHKSYMLNLRRFMMELANIENHEEREVLLLERRQEIIEAAQKIRSTALKEFRKNLSSCSLGIAGGAWSLATGDPFGAALAAAGLVSGLVGSKSDTVTAYSYLFGIQHTLGS